MDYVINMIISEKFSQITNMGLRQYTIELIKNLGSLENQTLVYELRVIFDMFLTQDEFEDENLDLDNIEHEIDADDMVLICMDLTEELGLNLEYILYEDSITYYVPLDIDPDKIELFIHLVNKISYEISKDKYDYRPTIYMSLFPSSKDYFENPVDSTDMGEEGLYIDDNYYYEITGDPADPENQVLPENPDPLANNLVEEDSKMNYFNILFVDIDNIDFNNEIMDQLATELKTRCSFIRKMFFVNSGGGAHIYIINKFGVSLFDWFILAEMIKSIVNNIIKPLGYEVDDQVIFDAFRATRCVNTYNFKYVPAILTGSELKIYDK